MNHMLPPNPFLWNPDHWARRCTWTVPDKFDHRNAILRRDDGKELLYDGETGAVAMQDTYFAPAGQMARGEHLVQIEQGLSLREARQAMKDIIERDIPPEETEAGLREAKAFVRSLSKNFS